LFRCKIFFLKCFRHFLVFGRDQKNGQRTEIIFSLTVKASLIFEKRFTVLNS